MTWEDGLAREGYEHDPTTWSLWPEISAFVGNWQQFLDRYWGLRATTCPPDLPYDKWEKVKQWAEIAPMILQMAKTMALPASRPGTELIELLRGALSAQTRNPLILQLLEIDIADGAATRLRGAGTRAEQLLKCVQPTPRSDRAAAYLGRVASLYIAGFDKDVPTVARAAMEHALKQALSDRGLSVKGQLDTLLKRAGENDTLPGLRSPPRDKDRRWDAAPGTPLWHADQIRKTGNFTTHEFPEFPPPDDGLKDAVAVLRSLALVLDALYAA